MCGVGYLHRKAAGVSRKGANHWQRPGPAGVGGRWGAIKPDKEREVTMVGSRERSLLGSSGSLGRGDYRGYCKKPHWGNKRPLPLA